MHVSGWTILLQAINFLVLVWLLQRFLYRPVLAVIEHRQAESERVLRDAAEARKVAEAMQKKLEQHQARLDEERAHALAAAQTAAQAERQSILDAARAENLKLMAGAQEQIGRERSEALTVLHKEAAKVAINLARQVLESTAPASVPPAMMEQLLSALMAIPETERARLLPAEASSVEVVAAAPLSSEQSATLQQRLGAIFGRPLTTPVTVNPALLAGLELHFAHSILRNTWRDRLNEAERTLGQA